MDYIDYDLAEEIAPKESDGTAIESGYKWTSVDVLIQAMEFMTEAQVRKLAGDSEKVRGILNDFYKAMMNNDWGEVMLSVIVSGMEIK